MAGISPIEKAFQNNARHELDSRIARMFYTSGLPFKFARNPYHRNSYAYAATHSIQVMFVLDTML